MSYMYIASPYTHDDPAVRQARFEKVTEFGAYLAKKGVWTFGPITHSHQMVLYHDMPHTFEFWDEWNRIMIKNSRGIIVLEIDGWNQSKGVAAELVFAAKIGLSVCYSTEVFPDYDHTMRQKPGERAAQGSPADEQSGEPSLFDQAQEDGSNWGHG